MMIRNKENLPAHVAIIMDGNRRWARQRNLPTIDGHRQGALRLEKIIEQCGQRGIKNITVYAFSSENRRRASAEVRGLMKILRYFLSRKKKKLHQLGAALHILGELSYFPDDLQQEIKETIALLKDNKRIHLNIALNYGGREEITRAVQKIMAAKVKNINPELVEQNLYTTGQPDPDLLIRTGGEKRLSNFLLWQVSYSELYFTEVLWPDFTEAELDKALADFSERQRRFGK